MQSQKEKGKAFPRLAFETNHLAVDLYNLYNPCIQEPYLMHAYSYFWSSSQKVGPGIYYFIAFLIFLWSNNPLAAIAEKINSFFLKNENQPLS